MSVLDVLDATRLCSRWSGPLADPSVWARPAAVPPRRQSVCTHPHSWRSLARNPRAILMTALVGADLAVTTFAQAARGERH